MPTPTERAPRAVGARWVLALLLACAEPAASSDTGDFELVLALDGSPSVGERALLVTVHDHDGAAVDHAALEVEAWMPAHGHASPMSPEVAALGGGRYRAAPIDFHMPGQWAIEVHVTQGEADGRATLALEVD